MYGREDHGGIVICKVWAVHCLNMEIKGKLQFSKF